MSRLFIAPSRLAMAQPEVPSSKYYTLRYVLAATLAEGGSRVLWPAESDDSDALFRGCQALGARLTWEDTQRSVLLVDGVGEPSVNGPVEIQVGNAGAVLRLLLGVGALLPEVTYVTDYPQSLGKRPNRELLEALTELGATCHGVGEEGLLPITLGRNHLHGGSIKISGARSSQYLSSLLFLAPFLEDGLEITVVDGLKSQPLVRATLEVLEEAGIRIEHDETLLHFICEQGQRYVPRTYTIPGDYPSAAALLAAYAASESTESELRLARLRPGDEIGDALLNVFYKMGADLHRDGDTLIMRGGKCLQPVSVDGDAIIDCIPVLVAAACFAEGESIFYNIESLHYKESDRIDDLCRELQQAGCDVIPQRDAIVVRGRPEGITGGATVDGHSDHRLLMALAIVGLHSQNGLILTGVEHISKSYPNFFQQLQQCGASIESR
jgi:3-phosphoshikimate 1-carboxyvinyltransferase